MTNEELIQIENWRFKAEKWDALGVKVGKCYMKKNPEFDAEHNNQVPEYIENTDSDLGTIGEITARAFGWL